MRCGCDCQSKHMRSAAAAPTQKKGDGGGRINRRRKEQNPLGGYIFHHLSKAQEKKIFDILFRERRRRRRRRRRFNEEEENGFEFELTAKLSDALIDIRNKTGKRVKDQFRLSEVGLHWKFVALLLLPWVMVTL